MMKVLRSRDTESAGFLTCQHYVAEKRQPTSLTHPTPPTLPDQTAPSLCALRNIWIQTRLQSLGVLADGYEAEVSVMMERIRKN